MESHATSEEESHNPHVDLINTFCEITSASEPEAQFFLESHNFDLDSALSTFLESYPTPTPTAAIPTTTTTSSSPSRSRSRSRSPSPLPLLGSQGIRPYNLRSREGTGSSKKKVKASGGSSRRGNDGGGIRTLSDLNRRERDGSGSEDDDDDDDYEPQEYYTGGEKSGMLVQDPSKVGDVDAIFNQARQSGAIEGPADHVRPSSSSRSFTGTARLLSGETVESAPQPPENVTHNIIFWSNGFTVDDGSLRRFDDPENASFLESIKKGDCPKELEPGDKRTAVHVNLMRKEENCPVHENRQISFQGVGRTLGSTSVEESTGGGGGAASSSLTTAPSPSMGLVVDQTLPSTSIQLRLADGTRMVSRFNYHHSIRDIRAFIDASWPGGASTYQLQTVGFPPKLLTDLDQTIEEAGLANSVVIQKL